VWDSLKARVIYGGLRVDTGSALTILPGTKVYLHMNSSLYISFMSTLTINGTLDHPVRFQGDRMDPYYKDLSGQWNGIFLEKGSKDHEVNYAILKNGIFGLSVDSLGSPDVPMLTISNSIIQNMAYYGIYAYGSRITAVNCVLGDCGRNCLAVDYGGDYNFTYLTVGNYWYSSVRNTSSLYLSNYAYGDNGTQLYNPLNSGFTNAIIYGSNEEEIRLDSMAVGQFDYRFDHAILKTKLNTGNKLRYDSCLVNQDPRFVDANAFNYMIDSISPAIKKGKELPGIPKDIRGFVRGNEPALGAYEYIKKD
jgi:hypothetical protein